MGKGELLVSNLPYVVAHRGASAPYPENTLTAFQAAVDLGVDWIELDVVTTADGVVIVSHNTSADRCTNGSGLFRDMSFEAVRVLDAGIRFGADFAGERIPMLNEVITLVERSPIRLNIEIKGDTLDEMLTTARASVKLLQQRDFFRQCTISSFNAACLREVRQWEPLLAVNLDPTPQDGSLTPWELCQQCLRCGANFMSHTYETLTPALLEEARAHGLAFWAWTINDADAMRQVAAMGVDAILTDDPAKLKDILLSETPLRTA
jgi:glycerophosphoryl diester phosphodiesterase